MKKGISNVPTPEYSPQSTTALEIGVEGPDELEGGGDDASPAAVSRCAGEQKSGESELCALLIRWVPVGEQRTQEEAGTETRGTGSKAQRPTTEVVLAYVTYSQVSAHVAYFRLVLEHVAYSQGSTHVV